MAAGWTRLIRGHICSLFRSSVGQPRVEFNSFYSYSSSSFNGAKANWQKSPYWKKLSWSPQFEGIASPHQVQRRPLTTSTPLSKYYVKPNYLKKWGRRDMKRRALFQEQEAQRSNLRLIKKSDILPSAVRKKAADDMALMPLNSSITRVRNRCVLTDRARGIVGRYRVSRMMFRYFAEKGSMAGMQKSQW